MHYHFRTNFGECNWNLAWSGIRQAKANAARERGKASFSPMKWYYIGRAGSGDFAAEFVGDVRADDIVE
jgi:hypothetical protein